MAGAIHPKSRFIINLHCASLVSTAENFLDRLVRHEAGVQGSFAADAMVTRFTKDMWKLTQEGGLTLTEASICAARHHKRSALKIAFG